MSHCDVEIKRMQMDKGGQYDVQIKVWMNMGWQCDVEFKRADG